MEQCHLGSCEKKEHKDVIEKKLEIEEGKLDVIRGKKDEYTKFLDAKRNELKTKVALEARKVQEKEISANSMQDLCTDPQLCFEKANVELKNSSIIVQALDQLLQKNEVLLGSLGLEEFRLGLEAAEPSQKLSKKIELFNKCVIERQAILARLDVETDIQERLIENQTMSIMLGAQKDDSVEVSLHPCEFLKMKDGSSVLEGLVKLGKGSQSPTISGLSTGGIAAEVGEAKSKLVLQSQIKKRDQLNTNNNADLALETKYVSAEA